MTFKYGRSVNRTSDLCAVFMLVRLERFIATCSGVLNLRVNPLSQHFGLPHDPLHHRTQRQLACIGVFLRPVGRGCEVGDGDEPVDGERARSAAEGSALQPDRAEALERGEIGGGSGHG